MSRRVLLVLIKFFVAYTNEKEFVKIEGVKFNIYDNSQLICIYHRFIFPKHFYRCRNLEDEMKLQSTTVDLLRKEIKLVSDVYFWSFLSLPLVLMQYYWTFMAKRIIPTMKNYSLIVSFFLFRLKTHLLGLNAQYSAKKTPFILF